MDKQENAGMRALDAEERVTEVVVTWGDGAPLEVVHLRSGQSYAPGSGTEGHPVALVRVYEDRAELDLPAGATLRSGPLHAGGPSVILGDDSAAVIELDGLIYAVRRMRGGRRVAGRVGLDRRPFAYALGSALVHLAIFAIFALEPPKAGALSTDVIDTQSRIVAHYIEAQETPPPPPASAASSDAAAGAEGEGARGEVGAAGDPRATSTGRRLAVRGQGDARAQRLGPLRPEAVAHAGVLGVLAQLQAVGPSSPYVAAQALGADPMDALGALFGATPGGSVGRFGLELTSSGSGGDDYLDDTIGVGRSHTVGRGPRPYGESVGGCDEELCGRAPRVPAGIVIGRPDAHGALAAEVIRRVVSRHRAEVRFCYEQGLQQNPDLEGRVTARFLIGPTGAVSSSMIGASSIHHRGVEQCIAQAIRRWSFPAPESGGMVTVNYPFVFSSGG